MSAVKKMITRFDTRPLYKTAYCTMAPEGPDQFSLYCASVMHSQTDLQMIKRPQDNCHRENLGSFGPLRIFDP